MSKGNARVVTMRRVVEGLTFTVSSRWVGLRVLLAPIGPAESAIVVDILSERSDKRCKISHGVLTFGRVRILGTEINRIKQI